MALSNKRQRIILTEARNLIYSNEFKGVCFAIIHVAKEKYSIRLNANDIEKIIPLFYFENAVQACKDKKVSLPIKGAYGSMWWASDNKKSRLAFLNWLIDKI